METTLTGVITKVDRHGNQTVKTDAYPPGYLSEMFMSGVCRIPGNPTVGTEVILYYETGSSYGLWFGKIK